MTITQRQFNHLNEMGVMVWQRKAPVSVEANKQNDTTIQNRVPIDNNVLTQYNLLTDIFQCLALSVGEVTIEENMINLGLFNWQFIDTETITFSQNTLTTPALDTLINNSAFKKALWATIQQEVLT